MDSTKSSSSLTFWN